MTHKYIVDSKLLAYWLHQRKRPISDIFNKLASLLMQVKKKGEVYICFDVGHSDFRIAEQSYYKAHRRAAMAKKSVAERLEHDRFNELYLQLQDLFKVLNVKVVGIPGVEADDLASIIARHFESNTDVKTTLITADRDWLHSVVETTNVRLWDFDQDKYYYPKTILQEYGVKNRREFSVLKAICGDDGDNIKFVRNLGTVKGTSLFELIYEKYEDPTNEDIILEVDTFISSKDNLTIHEFHAEDGRKTVREAFISNMKVADPFTSVSQLTKVQREAFLEIMAEPFYVDGTDRAEFFTKATEIFGYPIFLDDGANRVFNVM